MMLDSILREAVARQASDVHLTAGVPPVYRINGYLAKAGGVPLTAQDTEFLLAAVINEDMQKKFDNDRELDFSYAICGLSRFRMHAFKQRGTTALAIRLINEKIPTLAELSHPEVLKTLARKQHGLVLVTGPSGSGKSTTLAAMIDLINNERSCHIITLEDPIEYLHKHKRSIINQREIYADTSSFANALRAALREDPNVILVGEMRDNETIATAITAAETGHLILATLHTNDAAQTVDRIIDVFPPHQQQQIRVQLSLSLQGIVSQQLLPTADNTRRVAALEILVATPAVRNIIREGKTHQLVSVIQTGSKYGMQAMDMVLRDLLKNSIISLDEAMARATDTEAFMRLINSF